MVLEEATQAEPDFNSFDDGNSNGNDTSSSEPQNFATTSAQAVRELDISKYPRPIPLVGPVFGFTNDNLQQIMAANAYRFSVAANRPLNTDEIDAIAYHSAKRYSITSFASPLGFMAGIYRSETTKADFRFPFFKPDLSKFDFRSIPGSALKSDAIHAVWNNIRRLSYLCVSIPFARLIVGSYATTVAMVQQTQDPRLHEVREAIASYAKARIERGESPFGPGIPNQTPPRGTPSASQAPKQQPREDQVAWGSAMDNNASSAQQSTGSSFFEDDASPTAGNEPWNSVSSMSSSSTKQSDSNSAWDRVRRGAPPVPSRAEAARQQQVTTGDAWARVRGQGQSPAPGGDGAQDSGSSGDSFSFGESARNSAGNTDGQQGGWRR